MTIKFLLDENMPLSVREFLKDKGLLHTFKVGGFIWPSLGASPLFTNILKVDSA